MSTPDLQLSRIYGTTKEASDMATAARIAAAVLSLGLAASDKRHVEEKREERGRESDEKRQRESERMESMIEALKSASVSGQILARAVPPSQFEKSAFGAFMGKALGAALPGAKRIAGALTPGWKTKALATAGTVGAGYAGYKGLSALRDYASGPTGEDPTWGAKRSLKHNVSEWGYPVS